MDFEFKGKRVLVTGAGRGIGRKCVSRLVETGAQVVAISRTLANLTSLQEEFPSVETHCVDVGDWTETEKLVKSLGPIDLLVNNAAIGLLTPVVSDLVKEGDFDRLFDVNVKAVVNISQLVAQGMKERGAGGSIVNVSSQAGIAALKDHLVYAASKAAVDMITKIFALEFGPYNIRTNSVNPTVTLTEMAKVGWSEETKCKDMLSKIPLGRFAQPSEVVETILFLLSDKSSMVNGVLLPVDGGFLAC